ncbi:hypothetical protein RF55_14503 [Lasius niger]|uniref:Uncharacterized protein n=1 Tax=Lasius niger TaxID=67767 RepID=A0A0J7K810_LASNI|nr:hypothetical protein RF55_14503 [Lasius niger]
MPKANRNALQNATRRSRRIADRQVNNAAAAVAELQNLMAAPVAAAAPAPDAPVEVAAPVAAAAPAPDAPVEIAAPVAAAAPAPDAPVEVAAPVAAVAPVPDAPVEVAAPVAAAAPNAMTLEDITRLITDNRNQLIAEVRAMEKRASASGGPNEEK